MRNFLTDARAIFEAGVKGARADTLFRKHPLRSLLPHPPEKYQRIFVIGAGKAAMAMAGVVEEQLPTSITKGLVVVPHGYAATYPVDLPPPARIDIAEAGHPIPDEAGMVAAHQILDIAQQASTHDLVLVLISGGGSALLPAFAPGISLQDAQVTFQLLLKSGADIYEINTVRKHLSRIAGGRLAVAASPATIVSCIISDVVGDDLSIIASGPTVPDPSTFAETHAILQQRGIWKDIPASIRKYIEMGLRNPDLETPKPGHPAFKQVRNHLIGSNTDALKAAHQEAINRMYESFIRRNDVTGEARQVGPALVTEALQQLVPGEPRCFLWGGETTVTVQGSGKGGRNQELVLAAALAMEAVPHPLLILSAGTDGIDGPTDAAGAWADPTTAPKARRQGLIPEEYLARNDSYTFFHHVGQLIRTGPTHTNVMDLQIILGVAP